MFTLRIKAKNSPNYFIINKHSQMIVGVLNYSNITLKWYMNNRETKERKTFTEFTEAVREITQ